MAAQRSVVPAKVFHVAGTSFLFHRVLDREPSYGTTGQRDQHSLTDAITPPRPSRCFFCTAAQDPSFVPHAGLPVAPLLRYRLAGKALHRDAIWPDLHSRFPGVD